MARDHFFVLPPELRFKVYHELAISCLDDNRGSDISGLFFACRQTHQEMEGEYDSKVLLIFNVIHRWKTIYPVKGSLELEIAYDGDSLGSICIPNVTLRENALLPYSKCFSDLDILKDQVECLRRAFRLSNQTLRINISDNMWHMSAIASDLINILTILHDGQDPFGQATRLIFQGDSYFGDVSTMSNRLWAVMQQTHLYKSPLTCPYRIICHAWVARVRQEAKNSWGTWLVGYDFEEGLTEVADVVYRDGVHVA